ncbi:MAG: hypothetical protein ACJ8AK_13880 [Gemmatimonadaceae bacterium]
MQATTRTQSAADVAPQVKVPTVTVYTSDGKGQALRIPKSHEEMNALLARRREISDQLNSVTDRRNTLIEQLRVAPDGAAPGIQGQLNLLDARILQLETDLGTVGREVAAASPELISQAQQPRGGDGDNFGEGLAVGMGTTFVLMSAFYVFARRRWRKSRKSAPALPGPDSDRLQRLEQGMEAIAIEVERISEGQRFVTKLLSQNQTPESAPR